MDKRHDDGCSEDAAFSARHVESFPSGLQKGEAFRYRKLRRKTPPAEGRFHHLIRPRSPVADRAEGNCDGCGLLDGETSRIGWWSGNFH